MDQLSNERRQTPTAESEASSVETKLHAEGTPFRPNRRFYFAFFSLSVLSLAASLSTTSLSVAIITIAEQFQLSETQAFWLGTSAALTSTVFQTCCATLCDITGRKGALSFSAAAVSLGSLLAAVAQNYATIIAGRCIQGVGAGGISAVVDIIVTDLVPLRFRGQWFAYISVPWAVGTAAGPILSGSLTNLGLWRWISGLNALVSALAIPFCLWALPPLPRKRGWLSQLRTIDFVGFGILSSSLVSFLVAIMQATVVYPWRDVRTILPLILGVLGFCFFLVYEQRFARFPLIPLARFKNRSCLLTYFCTTIHGVVVWSLMYYMPVYYQSALGFNALETGIACLPVALTLVPASIVIGFMVGWVARYRWAIWAGWAASTAGLGLLQVLNESSTTAQWIGLSLCAGIGMGILFGAMGFAIQAAVDPEDVPLAVTLYSFWRAFGATLGISIGSSIFASELKQGPLHGRGLAPVLIVFQRSMFSEHFGPPQGASTVVSALRKVWIFCTGICGVALLASLGIQEFPLAKLERRDANTLEIETV